MGQNINQPDNQTTQPGSEPTEIGATGNAPSDNVSSPRTCQQPDEVGVRMMDMGTNMSDVEVRPHIDETRVVTSDANIQTPLPIVNIMIPTSGEDPIALPQINLSISEYGPNLLQDSQFGSLDLKMVHIFQELLYHAEGNIQEIVVMIIDRTEVRDPLKEENIQVRMGDHLIEGNILIGIEDLLEEEDILEEGPLMVEGPLMMEDPLMVEDP